MMVNLNQGEWRFDKNPGLPILGQCKSEAYFTEFLGGFTEFLRTGVLVVHYKSQLNKTIKMFLLFLSHHSTASTVLPEISFQVSYHQHISFYLRKGSKCFKSCRHEAKGLHSGVVMQLLPNSCAHITNHVYFKCQIITLWVLPFIYSMDLNKCYTVIQ